MKTTNKQLVVVGVSYRKTALDMRNKFALTTEQIKNIYQSQTLVKPSDFFILSTCNRTEIYSTTESSESLLDFLAQQSDTGKTTVQDYSFVKQGQEAIQHLFQVASGLDSQILGDYEIIGQLKNAFLLSKSYGCLGGYLEKLVNTSLQASRQVRKNTSISDGTTSVSYAVIQLLKQQTTANTPLNICLLGLGKIGTLTLKNLKTYLPQHKITLINRNEEKAQTIAKEFNVYYAPFEAQAAVIKNADVLIAATGADRIIIDRNQIENAETKLIFDLSVPSNISADVKEIPNLKLYDIDQLSRIVNQTLSQRQQQVPAALEIIEKHIAEFAEWEKRRELYIAQK